MSFAWYVALRYLTARRKQAFISLISLVSVLGVGVGVMALVIALALMTGVQGELRDRIVGSTAHMYIYKTGRFGPLDEELARMKIPGVTGASPAVILRGLLTSPQGGVAPATIKGIDPDREPTVTDIDKAIKSGSLHAITTRPDDEPPGVLLGEDLAKTLGVTLGDSVVLTVPEMTMTPGGPVPRWRQLTVVGTFEFGFYEYDSSYALVMLDVARRLTGSPADVVQLRLADMEQAPKLREQLKQTLGAGYTINDWTEVNGPLYSALWLEKVAISLAIGLIVMVAALNIVASLVLLVMEKSRDIAILRTMGAPAKAIRSIFMLQGLVIGLVGTIAGTTLGIIASYIADRYHLIKLRGDVYQITFLTFRVLPIDVLTVVVSAVVVCYLATIYPARQAGRLDPAEALRHD
jgi:lipoprotein-releasing system permease protein